MTALQPQPASWSDSDSQTNATATATRAAASGAGRHFVTHVSAAFSATPAAPVLLQLTDGIKTFEWYVSAPLSIDFTHPLEMTAGDAVSAVLSAGGAAVVGKVNLAGFTK